MKGRGGILMRKKKFSPVRIIFYLVLILFLIYQLYPIIWMIITSLKSPADVQRSSPFSFPDPIFTENYINAIKKGGFAPIFSQQRRGYYHHYGAGHFVQQYGGLCSGKTAV